MIFLNLGQDGSTNLFTADTLAEMRVYLQNWPAAAVAFDEAAEWTDEKYVAALEAWNKHVAKKEMTEEEKTAAVTLLQCIVAAATAHFGLQEQIAAVPANATQTQKILQIINAAEIAAEKEVAAKKEQPAPKAVEKEQPAPQPTAELVVAATAKPAVSTNTGELIPRIEMVLARLSRAESIDAVTMEAVSALQSATKAMSTIPAINGATRQELAVELADLLTMLKQERAAALPAAE